VVDIETAQILLMVNTAVFLGLYFYTLFDVRKIKRKSTQERFEEEGKKAAFQMVTASRRLLDTAGGKPILKEVVVRKKTDLALAEARLKYILDFIKRLIPGAIALAALFGFGGLSVNNTLAGRVLALFGAVVAVVIGGVETAAQRRLIEEKECIAMLEQAHAAQHNETSPLVLAGVDVQKHPRQGAACSALAMAAAPRLTLDQPCALQHALRPGVAHRDAVLSRQLLVEVADVEVEVLLPVEPQQDWVEDGGRDAPRARPSAPPVKQGVKAELARTSPSTAACGGGSHRESRRLESR
jgi:hypothetical protein